MAQTGGDLGVKMFELISKNKPAGDPAPKSGASSASRREEKNMAACLVTGQVSQTLHDK